MFVQKNTVSPYLKTLDIKLCLLENEMCFGFFYHLLM